MTMTPLDLAPMTLLMAATCLAGGESASTGWEAAYAGRPVDIAPWAYSWRADREVQDKPEACFIPRRLERLDRVYRTAKAALPESELKSIYYDQPDMLRDFPPAPKGKLLAGLLWTGGLVDYTVALRWPEGSPMPEPGSVEVRAYPTAFGWFGWTVDQILTGPAVSDGGRCWRYASDPTRLMDTSYSAHIPAATEMVAVFCEGEAAVPEVGVSGPSSGTWRPTALEIEWGFAEGREGETVDGRLETHVAILGPVSPLEGDASTRMVGAAQWRSRIGVPASGGALARLPGRRGVRVEVLEAPTIRPGLDSRLTLRVGDEGVTFRVSDLERGPIYLPRQGLFIAKAGGGATARQFVRRLEAERPKSLREMTGEHAEVASWQELMDQVRFWTCPEGTPVPPFPEVPEPPVTVDVSDARWTAAWRTACDQLRGRHLWPMLSAEIARVARDMELLGLHDEVVPVYEYFLGSPGVKSDGDFTDPAGSLEWARSMRHDMGYSHEGTHASTGRMLFAICERYFLSDDPQWFLDRRARLQEAAEWILSERRRYMEHVPNRDELHVAGLMPPSMLGDYALPACDWHWYYCENAWCVQGLQRFADVLAEIDPASAPRYAAEAAAFREDLRRALDREAMRAPVRLGRDGAYHSYLPRMAYGGGITGPELGAPQFPDCDLFLGALPVANRFAALEPTDPRVVDTLEQMDEMGTSGRDGSGPGVYARPLEELEQARAAHGLSAEDAWFYKTYSVLPKITENANLYLEQDDIPSFLRFWGNAYAGMVGANGKLWEHWHLGSYAECDTPDTMSAGWFLENFRNMLLMEDEGTLWLGRGTPRAWLGDGKHIRVVGAPSYFGTVSYEVRSHAASGTIEATLELPSLRPIERVLLRFRHFEGAPLVAVTVDGKPWSRFDPARELIELPHPVGTLVVEARYGAPYRSP